MGIIYAPPGGSGGVAAPVTIADGADTAQGSTTDPAVTDPSLPASEISLLKGLLTFERNGEPTDGSGTIAAGGVAQNAMAANAARRGFLLQNVSAGNLWFSETAVAVQNQPSQLLPPGAYPVQTTIPNADANALYISQSIDILGVIDAPQGFVLGVKIYP